MKNKNVSLFISIMIVLVLCMWGCKSRDGEVAMPEKSEAVHWEEKELSIPEGYFFLAGEQVFLSYSSNDVGRAYFPLISASPLSEEDISIEIAGRVMEPSEYKFNFYGLPDCFQLPFYAYQIFRGKDWEEECQLQLEYRQTQEDMEMNYENIEAFQEAATALKDSQNEYLEDYEALKKQNRLPVLYRYTLSITMPKEETLCGMPITEITLRAMGREKTFSIGEIKYTGNSGDAALPLSSLVRSKFSGGWLIASPVSDGRSVWADGNGNILLNGLGSEHLRAMEDLYVTAIDIWDDSRQLADIRAVISIPNENGSVYDEVGNEIHNIVADYMWDGETPIFVEKGQELSIDALIYDNRLVDAVCGQTSFKIAFHYKNADGKQGITMQDYSVQLQTISGDPFEIYLQYELGINAMSYYTDYYSVLSTEEYGGITIIEDIS